MSPEFSDDARPQWPSAQNQPSQPVGSENAAQAPRPPQPPRITRPPQGIGRPVVSPTSRVAVGQTPQWLLDQQRTEQTQPESGLLGFAEQNTEEKNRPFLKAMGWTVVATFVLGLGGVVGDEVLTGGKNLEKIGFGKAPREHDAATPAPQESSSTSAKITTPPSTPSITITKSPTTTPKPTSALVMPATAEGCAQAMPANIKIGQLVESTIDANSDMTEINKISSKYHLGSWLVLKYPVKADGKMLDTDAIKALKATDKNIPTLITIDGEGGQINRLPGATIPPGPETISTAKPQAAALQKQLETYFGQLKAAGVDVNLAPVVDVDTPHAATTKTYGRLFKSPADEAKYLPVYNAAAKATDITLTYKHFPKVLPDNTDTLAKVTTAPYADLEKAGYLDGYKLVKGTNNWVMMGSAYTSGFPNKKLDNGKISVFNPAAYDAARLLAGDPLFVTDALNGKAVNAVASQADAAAMAINAGADIAMVVPSEGKSTSDTVAALQAIEKNVSKARIDAAFLKVLAAKSINACAILPQFNPAFAAPKTATASPTKAPSTPKPASTTVTTSPVVTSKLTATAKPKVSVTTATK